MTLKSLTYTSFARLDLTDEDVAAIHAEACSGNLRRGITGLLIFNGTHFLQIIEGENGAVDQLLDGLRSDPRHRNVEVRDSREIDRREFPDWSMELIRVNSRYFEAQDAIVSVLPAKLPPGVVDNILQMTRQISGTVNLPD